MTSVATSQPEQGLLVSVRSRQWIVNDVRPSTLPTTKVNPLFDPPDKLDTFFDSVRWGAAFTADVKNIRSSFHFVIDSGDELLRLFAFEEPPTELRAVRVMAIEAAQGEKFVIPQNLRVSASSVIPSLFEGFGDQDAASRENLRICAANWDFAEASRRQQR
jgi:hypothetical protein